MEAQGEAQLVLQAQDVSGAQLSFEAPLAAAEKVPGDALAVLHAMAYIGGLLSGSSHLHLKADGTPLDKQPEADIVKEEVRGAACLPALPACLHGLPACLPCPACTACLPACLPACTA